MARLAPGSGDCAGGARIVTSMAIEVRILEARDAALIIAAGAELFDLKPQPGLTEEFLSDPRHHGAGAIDGTRLVGFATAVHYVHPDKAAELWINEVGVVATHQRQGIARRLLEAMLELGRELGCKQAWVLTERANVAAVQLYAAAGGVEADRPAILFEFKLD